MSIIIPLIELFALDAEMTQVLRIKKTINAMIRTSPSKPPPMYI